MTTQNVDQTVRVEVKGNEVYVYDNSPNTTVTSVLVENVLPHEMDDLKHWMNDESLKKVWNQASIIEQLFNTVIELSIEAKGGQELVSLNEMRRQLEVTHTQDELERKTLEILEETFGEELEAELEEDAVGQCIEHIVLVLEFTGVLDPVYETPYGEDALGKLAGAKLTKVGRVIRALLYEDRWETITIGDGPYTLRRFPNQTANKKPRRLTEDMKQNILDAMNNGG